LKTLNFWIQCFCKRLRWFFQNFILTFRYWVFLILDIILSSCDTLNLLSFLFFVWWLPHILFSVVSYNFTRSEFRHHDV
jgi:hypothetical protein